MSGIGTPASMKCGGCRGIRLLLVRLLTADALPPLLHFVVPPGRQSARSLPPATSARSFIRFESPEIRHFEKINLRFIFSKVAGAEGFEPPTYGFGIRRSTN